MRFRTRFAAARYSAQCRWRAAEQRAQAERDAGIRDRDPYIDARQPITIDLRSYGGQLLHIEPRAGYIAVRVLDESGAVVQCAALKTALHRIADDLPRTLAPRNLL
jgi:hypothetical protein